MVLTVAVCREDVTFIQVSLSLYAHGSHGYLGHRGGGNYPGEGTSGIDGVTSVIQVDERQSHLAKNFAQQPSIFAGCMPVLCCVLGHSVVFSCSLLL